MKEKQTKRERYKGRKFYEYERGRLRERMGKLTEVRIGGRRNAEKTIKDEERGKG